MNIERMQLMYGALSPFVRKVMVSAHEKNLVESIDLVPTAVGAGKTNETLMALNPVGKIPALVLADGTPVHDSTVIIDHFDTLVPEPRLIPAAGKARIRALRMNATADGLLVAGVLVRAELSRPETGRWAEWHDAQLAKVRACLQSLDREVQDAGATPTIGEVAAGIALGWVDFRMSDVAWRDTCPQLARWYAEFAQRPSMLATAPKG